MTANHNHISPLLLKAHLNNVNDQTKALLAFLEYVAPQPCSP